VISADKQSFALTKNYKICCAYLFFGILNFLMITINIPSVMAQVELEKTWVSLIGFDTYSFSPKHTYGISNELYPCRLFDLKTGNLVLMVDSTNVLITDYTGKTFFVKDSINQKFYVYDLTTKEMIKELTYRNYITRRAVSDSLMFEFDRDAQIITLWNIYDDRIVMQKDLNLASNYSGEKYDFVTDHSFDGRFIRFSKYKYSLSKYIYDSNKNEFIVDLNIQEFFGDKSKFMNLSNNFIFIEKMKMGSDTIESDYFRFYNLESRSIYKNVKIMQYRNGVHNVENFLINSNDDYILYYIASSFFYEPSHNIYDIINDRFNDKTIGLTNKAIYFGNSIIIDYSNQAFRVKTPTSISYENHNVELNLYPNPASDYIELSLDRWTPPTRWSPSDKIQVFNMLGVEVKDLTPALSKNGEGVRIDVSDLPAGVYFVRIGGMVEKFVKM